MRPRDLSKPLKRAALLELLVCEMFVFVEHQLGDLTEGAALEHEHYEQMRSTYKDICRERYEDIRANKKVDNG